jgi:hypothetical protein
MPDFSAFETASKTSRLYFRVKWISPAVCREQVGGVLSRLFIGPRFAVSASIWTSVMAVAVAVIFALAVILFGTLMLTISGRKALIS